MSFLLISIDHQHNHLSAVRNTLSIAVYPINYIVNAPIKFFGALSEHFSSRRQLVIDNRSLREQNQLLRSRQQRLISLQQENTRLRELLDSTAEFDQDVVVADVMAIETSPTARQIVLNKGSKEKIYVGQPVVDAYGVIGQIIRVDLFSSTALLITDLEHGLPVQIARSGLRTIAAGAEEINRLQLSFVPINADVEIGDKLVTSGLGQRFPAGYPVGEVVDIDLDPSEPFQRITAKPVVDANRVSQVLLIYPVQKGSNTDRSNKDLPNKDFPDKDFLEQQDFDVDGNE